MIENITYLGHASFFFIDPISGNSIYYVDPFEQKISNLQKADIIFITHAHQDHFSMEDIEKIKKPETIIVAPPDIIALTELPAEQTQVVKPNEVYTIKGFSFQTVPAYNISPDKLHFHPQNKQWVGYIFTLNEKKIYHAGDTDFIPEMQDFNKYSLDVVMLPIGGTYTMAVEEAAEAANAISARVTVPMHYKRLLREQAHESEELFKKLVTGSEVVVMTELS